MGNSIYPDLSGAVHDVKYAKRKLFASDIQRVNIQQRVITQTIITQSTGDGGGGGTTALPPPEITPPVVQTKCCSRLVFVDKFRVGNEGAPMVEGDMLYTNAAIKNNNIVIFADGVPLDQTNNPSIRNIQKAFDSDTVIFNGGVYNLEVIEIYIVFIPIMNGLVDYFIVGAAGSPMADGATTYTNSRLSGHRFLMMADSTAINQMDDLSDRRYCSKPISGAGDDTITINGGVNAPELIQIYEVF